MEAATYFTFPLCKIKTSHVKGNFDMKKFLYCVCLWIMMFTFVESNTADVRYHLDEICLADGEIWTWSTMPRQETEGLGFYRRGGNLPSVRSWPPLPVSGSAGIDCVKIRLAIPNHPKFDRHRRPLIPPQKIGGGNAVLPFVAKEAVF